MNMHRKGLYNNVRLNWLQNPSVEVEKWQVQDYQVLSDEQLFQMLGSMGIRMDRANFVAYSNEVDTPQDLTDMLLDESEVSPEEEDKVFLVCFELWRRCCPHKITFDHVCDDLDAVITAIDQGSLNEQAWIDPFWKVMQLLQDYVDHGTKPHLAFQTAQDICGNELEVFFYDQLASMIDQEDSEQAQEIIESLYPFISEPLWFDFLLVRIQDAAQASKNLKKIYRSLSSDFQDQLCLEVLEYLSDKDIDGIFPSFFKLGYHHLSSSEDLQELQSLASHYTAHHRNLPWIEYLKSIGSPFNTLV